MTSQLASHNVTLAPVNHRHRLCYLPVSTTWQSKHLARLPTAWARGECSDHRAQRATDMEDGHLHTRLRLQTDRQSEQGRNSHAEVFG